MASHRVLELTGEVDLKLFCAYLWQRGIAHRVFEERGRQVLELADPGDAAEVREQFNAWRDGSLQLALAEAPKPTNRLLSSTFSAARRYPVLAGLVAAAIVCFPATWPLDRGTFSAWLGWMTFVDVTMVDGYPRFSDLATTLRGMQLWRLLTPVLLHFSVVHLLFNLAVVVEFGRRIEAGAGSRVLAIAVVLIAVSSNLAQYLASATGLFGGLSGVAFGLVGLVAVRARRYPNEPVWRVNPSFLLALLVFLVLMSTGVTERFGLHIANAAHWVGLVSGAVLGLVPWQTRHDRST